VVECEACESSLREDEDCSTEEPDIKGTGDVVGIKLDLDVASEDVAPSDGAANVWDDSEGDSAVGTGI